MKHRCASSFAFAWIVFGLLQTAAAAVIYRNGILLGSYGSPSDFAYEGGGFGITQSAENFMLAPGRNTVTDIHWWGFYSPQNTPEPDNFTLRFFPDDGGLPAAAPDTEIHLAAVTRIDTGTDTEPPFAFDIYAYSAEIAPVTLPAGQVHWMSIVNHTSSSEDAWAWLVTSCCSSSIFPSAYRNVEGANWSIVTAWELGFNLTDDAVFPDYNQNGTVDAADYVVWRKNVGSTNPLPNDAIGGTIGSAQYDQWRSHFGQTASSSSNATSGAVVPEPVSAELMLFAAIGELVALSERRLRVVLSNSIDFGGHNASIIAGADA